MTQITKVHLFDDIDAATGKETEAVATVKFVVNGVSFEMELSSANLAKWDKAISPWTSAARVIVPVVVAPVKAPKPRASKETSNATVIREWAVANGIAVSARGRIANDVTEQFHAAQSTKIAADNTEPEAVAA